LFLDATKNVDGQSIRYRKKFNTGQTISPQHWDNTNRTVKGKAPNAFKINSAIDTFKAEADKKVIELSSGKFVELEGELKVLANIFGQGIKKNKAKGKGY
jgi:hypothetical protein